MANNTVMNIGVQLFFFEIVFLFSSDIPNSEIAGYYGSSIFRFLWNLHSAFHSSCTTSHSHQECTRVSLSPHPHQPLLFVIFWMTAILTRLR